MNKQQPEAQERKFWKRLCALNRFSFFYMGGGVARASDKSGNWIEVHSAQEIVDDAECEVSTQHARITELESQLESQLAQRFDAADMATAAAQGFRVGATAPAQPAAQHVTAYAALPVPNYPKSGGFPGTFAEAQMRAFADATHTLRASHGQAPAGAGMGHTDGGRNMFYEGRFDGESQHEQQARLRWANDMRAAFERHTGNGWFDKDWRTETGLWSSAWHACLAAQPSPTAQAADSVQEDAARYRALRDEANQLHEDDISVSDSSFTTYFGSDLDEAVDALVKRAARKQGETP